MDYKTLTEMLMIQHDKKVIKQILYLLEEYVPDGKKI